MFTCPYRDCGHVYPDHDEMIDHVEEAVRTGHRDHRSGSIIAPGMRVVRRGEPPAPLETELRQWFRIPGRVEWPDPVISWPLVAEAMVRHTEQEYRLAMREWGARYRWITAPRLGDLVVVTCTGDQDFRTRFGVYASTWSHLDDDGDSGDAVHLIHHPGGGRTSWGDCELLRVPNGDAPALTG